MRVVCIEGGKAYHRTSCYYANLPRVKGRKRTYPTIAAAKRDDPSRHPCSRCKPPNMEETGRPTKLTPKLWEQICRLLAAGNCVSAVCDSVNINRSTFYRWLKDGEKGEEPFATLATQVKQAAARAGEGPNR